MSLFELQWTELVGFFVYYVIEIIYHSRDKEIVIESQSYLLKGTLESAIVSCTLD